jgi:competence protein ComEA
MKSLVILMLFMGAAAPASVPAVALTPAVAQERPATAPLVNINTATAAALESLPGIGPATAKRILEYREKSGPFKKIEDLMNVRGIGEKAFLRLRPLVTIGGSQTGAAPTQS